MMKMDKEKALAGILGIVALVCIVVQLVSGGISTSSVAGAIKDLTGIAIQILVFILAIRIVTKKNEEEPPLETKLENALDQWRAEHANMILRDEEYDTKIPFYSFFMRTDIRNFFGDPKAQKKPGWFVRVPKIGSPEYIAKTFKMHFHLNVSTFLEGKPVDDRKDAFESIADEISAYLQAKNNITVDKIQVTDSDATITVIANGLVPDGKITVDDRIRDFISIIDTAYTCYLVAGNFKV